MMRPSRAIALGLLYCPLVACTTPATWRQFHSDASNTGTMLVATQAPMLTSAKIANVSPSIAHASPVVAPDGHVYVATWTAGGELGQSTMVQLAATGVPSVTRSSASFSGQLSTPAVDGAGNIYAALYASFGHGVPQSTLLRFDSTFSRFQSLDLSDAAALSAPKILEGTGSPPLIVQTYINSLGANHVLILDGNLKALADWETCEPDQPSVWDNLYQHFQVPGIALGPPYGEPASVGIRAVDGERGKTLYLVAAGNGCGVTFYTIDPTLSNPKVMTFIKHQGSDAAMLTSPAISADGIAVIADSDHHITAYDITTGDQKWQSTTNGFVAATPTMGPGSLSVVYVATYSEVIKFDLATGLPVRNNSLTGTFTDASPAAAGNLLFVSTSAGLFTFTLSDLGFVSSAPFAAGQSSPAVGADGYVIAASTDGQILRFPGP